jgi:hypothetical protein
MCVVSRLLGLFVVVKAKPQRVGVLSIEYVSLEKEGGKDKLESLPLSYLAAAGDSSSTDFLYQAGVL